MKRSIPNRSGNTKASATEKGKTNKLVSLFAVATLVVATGCNNSSSADQVRSRCKDLDRDGYCDDEYCEDKNRDGYCDDGSGHTGSRFTYIDGKKMFYKKSGISRKSDSNSSSGSGSGFTSGSGSSKSGNSKSGIGSSNSGGWFSGG
ncbi:hypothetical protein [Kroppenstedtia pulmonis]|uniref:hypothetical protein n=1 Tax=Kroppenstedtia pulmonis TaxID=1380685 RepID=UPI001FE53508|nr:hypothetical protein [Kroppenstedtia pulmonis]